MKKFVFLLIIFSLFINFQISNEEYATTESGKKVLLHDNGTWEYYVGKKEEKQEEKIEVIEEEFTKSENVKTEVKGSRKTYSIWYNDSKWAVSKINSKNNNIEYSFSNKDKDITAMMIYEKTKIQIDTLKKLVLFNANSDGVNVKLLKTEIRTVNNNKLHLIKYSTIVQGYKHIFYGYIFSNKKGSYQFITNTEAVLFDEVKDDIEELINGLVIN
jgi:hypothetical protein